MVWWFDSAARGARGALAETIKKMHEILSLQELCHVCCLFALFNMYRASSKINMTPLRVRLWGASYRCQVSQADREANGQGCRAGDITPPFISDCNDTQHQLEGCQELDAHALAGSDTSELRELREESKTTTVCQSVSVRRIVSHPGHFPLPT